jgi:hypothetical protein
MPKIIITKKLSGFAACPLLGMDLHDNRIGEPAGAQAGFLSRRLVRVPRSRGTQS